MKAYSLLVFRTLAEPLVFCELWHATTLPTELRSPVGVNLSSDGNIVNATCNCVAGASCFCCHLMALLYLIDHTLK